MNAPAPTPVSKLGPLFKRQQKYHPARPYRWWEFRPTPPETPEVFYPPVETYEEWKARQPVRKPPGFWTYVGVAVFLLLLWGAFWLLGWLALGGLQLLLDTL
jgi:hypothetical protein